jgi:LuxR family maltose regulon positive regulatory protein
LGLLNRAERLSWERGWGRVVAALLVERTRLLLAARNVSEVLSLLQAFEQLKAQHPASSPSSWAEIHTHAMIAKGLVASATGHVEDAVLLLQNAYDGLLSTEDHLSALRVGLDLAMAYYSRGTHEQAYGILKHLMTRAAKGNLVSFVLERNDNIAELLLSATEARVFDNDSLRFVTGLLAEIRNREAPPRETTASRSGQDLTARERSIVAFIAMGQSNKEIAREIGVTPETVKTHVKRIFQKLSAETRAQAVIRAQSLGMLGSTGLPLDARSPAGGKPVSL